MRPIRRPLGPSQGFETLFASGEARHDFVEVAYTARVRGRPADLDTVLKRLKGRRDTDVLRLRQQGTHRWLLDTRPGTALFSAKGNVDVPPGQDLLLITLVVQLNPTRFLAHQPDKRPSAVTLRPYREALRPDPLVAQSLAARTLDGEDNFLETTPDIPAPDLRDPWWAGILRSYLGKVSQFLRERLDPEGARVQVDRADFGPIRKAEVQWEFGHRDAIAWAATFCNALRSADDATETRMWRGTEARQNVQAGYLFLTKDVRLKVYAKTAHIVRFEIVFSEASRITQALKRHGFSSDADIVARMQGLRGEAVKQINKAWATIMDVTAEADAAADMFDFMARMNRKVPEQNQRRVLLSLLGSQRRVTATPSGGVAPDTVCRGLVREGILIPAGIITRGPARYALAPAWSAMFDRLLARSDAAITLH